MRTSNLPSTPAARGQLEVAMQRVEQAQRLLDNACQALCSVRRGSDLYKKTGKLSLQVQELWHQLDLAEAHRGGMSVDSEPEVK